MLSTFQAVGGTIGVAVVASLAAARTTAELGAGSVAPQAAADALMSGFGVGFAVTAGLASAAVLVALVTAPGRSAS